MEAAQCPQSVFIASAPDRTRDDLARPGPASQLSANRPERTPTAKTNAGGGTRLDLCARNLEVCLLVTIRAAHAG
jgi:hypothetical protein